MTGYDHGDYWTGLPTADVIGERLSTYFADVAYRTVGMRISTITERPVLEDTQYLSEYSLSLF